MLTVGLVAAIAADVAGPSRTATRVRASFRGMFGRTAGNAWVYESRGVLRTVAAAGAGRAFVFWDHPTGKVVLLLVALTLVAFAAIEVLGGMGGRGG